MAIPRKVDYDRIEPLWRAGLLSPRQIAEAYTKETGEPLSHAAVIKHFTKRGIPRDLSAKIRAKAEELVTRAVVTESVTPEARLSEKQIVDGNANAVAAVLISQQADIRKGRAITQSLFAELESLVADPGVFEQLADLMDKSDDGEDGGRSRADKLNEIYRKVISMPGRVDSAKKLVETLEKLVKMERQAFGLDVGGGEENPQGGGKPMTDVERAVRLMHFIRSGAQQ